MKLGRRRNYHKGRAALRHYANLREPLDSLRFKLYCEGAVTKELSTVVKICEEGKLKIKRKSDIAPGWPKAGGGEGSSSLDN